MHTTTTSARTISGAATVLDNYRTVRRWTETLIEPLAAEDFVVQSMPDVSPTRWHIAHTTWFFETFVLGRAISDYQTVHPAYEVLFNSYYNSVGEQFPRARRGLLTRPTVADVREYRHIVDERMEQWLSQVDSERDHELLQIVELGLHHEQQHQELMLTDLKHVFFQNPLYPAYREPAPTLAAIESVSGVRWIPYGGDLATVGYAGTGFAYDNESPRHRVFLEPFELADRLATAGEYLDFIGDGGYRRPELWLSAGWNWVQDSGARAPLYWVEEHGEWSQFTLHGLQPLNKITPVCHVNYFEADAFARWAGARLPTEFEWETAASDFPIEGHFAEDALFHPQAASFQTPSSPSTNGDASLATRPRQMFGDVWEWTSSSYAPYPGYRPVEGALGEYNGKFMCNQYVLRGGSVATPRSHIRATYRNFFPTDASWQFSGIRLARSV